MRESSTPEKHKNQHLERVFSYTELVPDDFHGYVTIPRTDESMFSRLGECKVVEGVRSRWCSMGYRTTGHHSLLVLSQSPIPAVVSRSDLSQTWIRGLKKKATIRVKDLPQGPLPAKAADRIVPSDRPAYPTVIQQARNNMHKFAHCVVLTRVGSFYEVIEARPLPLICLADHLLSSSTLIKLMNTHLFST